MASWVVTVFTLTLGSRAGAQEVLPRNMRFMQAATEVPFEPLQSKAADHGFDCVAVMLFTYDNSTLATQSVNEWLKMNNLQAKTVDSSPGLIQWKATSNGQTNLYAIWDATGSGGKGRLWMCSGTDRAAQARQEVEQAQGQQIARSRNSADEKRVSQQLSADEAPHYVRIPLWPVFAVIGALASLVGKIRNRFALGSRRVRE